MFLSTPHPTIPLIINGETCDIDVEISDLILLLNKLPGIITEFSCQGDKRQKLTNGDFFSQSPYFTFHTDSENNPAILLIQDILQQIINNSKSKKTDCRYEKILKFRKNDVPEIVYVVYFDTKKSRDQFYKILKNSQQK